MTHVNIRLMPIGAAILLVTAFARADAPPSGAPIVVELFTSEGCSSCPPADTLLQRIADSEQDVIVLGEHVDYWDQLGWRDRFSSAAYTARQQVYSSRLADGEVYTPQMIVDGREAFVGSNAAAAKRALDRARTTAHGSVRVAVSAGASALSISIAVADLPALSRGDRADVIVAVTEDRLRSDVKHGENRGHVLTHAAVVRYLSAAGEAAASAPSTIKAEVPIGREWQRDALKVVAFVQERRSRAILGAAAAPVAAR